MHEPVSLPFGQGNVSLLWLIRSLPDCLTVLPCFPTAMSSCGPSTSSRPPRPVLAQAQPTIHGQSTPHTATEFSRSSPIKENVAEHFAEDNRSEVQAFAYDMEIVRLKYDGPTPFLEFLNVPSDRFPSKPDIKFDNFLKVANTMAKSMKKLREYLPLYLAPLTAFN
jgi:hypothetical protein